MIAMDASEKLLVDRFMHDVERASGRKTDTTFVKLMFLQWAAMIALALTLSPHTWNGPQFAIHPHVLAAVFGGGLVCLLPLLFSRLMPGERPTRHVIAVCQMLASSLLILLTNGRIETHFHIFVSLALLAFYFDWTVLFTASAVVAADHILRGSFSPETIFGVSSASHWRWLEHAGWVIVLDIFLIVSNLARRRNLRALGEVQIQQSGLLTKAYNDALTGLPNRLRYQHRIAELLETRSETQQPFALMYIDLDRFKEVNDSAGHAAGDAVLREVATRLSEYVGPQSLLARLGGDEFIAIFADFPGREQIADISEEITAMLMLPFHYKGQQFSLGASIGISIFPEHGVHGEDLLHRADQAMYRVKLRGRRGYSFYEHDSAAQTEDEFLTALESAISADQFEVHYQPFVNAASHLTGFEALVRWRCPVRGLISPAQFIPAAETSGLIVPLGRLILSKVIAQAAVWRTRNLSFGFITVNVSPLQMTERGFVSYVGALLQDYGVPASVISLECTESACASDPEVQRCLEQFRDLGLSIYIDDFGTGYSSLGRLHEMQFDVIKIDRSFINRITVSEKGREIVGLMISFAHLIGMAVVAEGVETNEQYGILQSMGCDHIQGYLISKPLSSADAASFITNRPDLHKLPRHSVTSATGKYDGEKQEQETPTRLTPLLSFAPAT